MSQEEKEELKWRLKEQPTTESLRQLVKDKILSTNEAREILFSKETKIEKTKDDLEKEVKFLRELVDKLSKNRPTEVIRYIESRPWINTPWFKPYVYYANAASNSGSQTINLTGALGSGTVGTISTTGFKDVHVK